MLDIKNNYNYTTLENHLKILSSLPEVKIFSIGESVLGKKIYCIKFGCGSKNVLYNAAHHGLEWITSPILTKFTEDVLKTPNRILGFDIKKLLSSVTFHLVPMVNPDGVEIAQNGLNKDNPMYKQYLLWNQDDNFKSKWQANANGVDLNHNYDACFALSKRINESAGITGPNYTRYTGKYAESEPESHALCNYVRRNRFSLTLSFHSQGEVIYYDYNGHVPPNGYEIGKILCKKSGYIFDKAEGITSCGGFKDWFIKMYNKPAYTIEVGKGKNPLPFSQFEDIYSKCLPLMLNAAALA